MSLASRPVGARTRLACPGPFVAHDATAIAVQQAFHRRHGEDHWIRADKGDRRKARSVIDNYVSFSWITRGGVLISGTKCCVATHPTCTLCVQPYARFCPRVRASTHDLQGKEGIAEQAVSLELSLPTYLQTQETNATQHEAVPQTLSSSHSTHCFHHFQLSGGFPVVTSERTLHLNCICVDNLCISRKKYSKRAHTYPEMRSLSG